MVTVSIDDFLYKYFNLFKDKTSVSIYDLNMIKRMVCKHNKDAETKSYVLLNFYKDDILNVYMDFFYSIKENAMTKRYDVMNLEEDTINNYIRIPDVVVQCMLIYERNKKIKKIKSIQQS